MAKVEPMAKFCQQIENVIINVEFSNFLNETCIS